MINFWQKKFLIDKIIQITKSATNSIIAFSFGLLAAFFVILIFVQNPANTAFSFFTAPFSSSYYFGSFINSASILLYSSLGAVIALVSGNLNLGGEGQIYLGGFLTAVFMNIFQNLYPPVAFFLTAFIVMCVCGFFSFISAFLKIAKNISVLLTSFLISSALIPILDGLISGPFRDKTGNLLATSPIPSQFKFSVLNATSISPIIPVLGVMICVMCTLLLYKARIGSRFRIAGKAPLFAEYSGYLLSVSDSFGLFFSGALHGLAGFFAVCGIYHTCYSSFSLGMGWNALTVALIAKSNPLAVIPASLVFSYILTATDCAILENSFGFDLTGLIQSVIILCVSANIFVHNKRV